MSNATWLPAIRSGSLALPAQIETARGYLPTLERMTGEGFSTYCLWHYRSDTEFELPEHLENYLQAAGSAEAMTLELRETHEDGTYSHWVLGREEPTGEPSETITWDGHEIRVHPEEVWTADQAAALFEQYSAQRTIPGWVHRRLTDI